MKTVKLSIRRVVAGAATLAAVTTAVAAPAHAGGAAECLDQLSTASIAIPPNVVAKPTTSVWVTTGLYDRAACSGVTAVSIAISRLNGADVRNANATSQSWEEGVYYWGRSATLTSKDTGYWMIRQIVVKDAQGGHGRPFTSSTTPGRFFVKAGTVISPRQHGTLRPGAGGRVTISGDLKAWNTRGGLSPLAAGQRLTIEIRDPYRGDYFPIAYVGTAPSGWFRGYPVLNKYRGFDVRLAYYTPYQTIAGGYAYVGRVA